MLENIAWSRAFWEAIHAPPPHPRALVLRPVPTQPTNDAQMQRSKVNIALLERLFKEKSGGLELSSFLELKEVFWDENVE